MDLTRSRPSFSQVNILCEHDDIVRSSNLNLVEMGFVLVLLNQQFLVEVRSKIRNNVVFD